MRHGETASLARTRSAWPRVSEGIEIPRARADGQLLDENAVQRRYAYGVAARVSGSLGGVRTDESLGPVALSFHRAREGMHSRAGSSVTDRRSSDETERSRQVLRDCALAWTRGYWHVWCSRGAVFFSSHREVRFRPVLGVAETNNSIDHSDDAELIADRQQLSMLPVVP